MLIQLITELDNFSNRLYYSNRRLQLQTYYYQPFVYFLLQTIVTFSQQSLFCLNGNNAFS